MSTNRKPNVPVLLFYSYSHKDETYREELGKHLAMLQRSGLISEWYDRKILPGEEWDKKISEYLEKSDVILLLISSDFLASEYCYDIEARRALERHDKGEAILIPVILRPVEWNLTPFSKIQALPRNALPVVQWGDRDLAYVNVCEGILALLTSLSSGQKETHPENIDNNPVIKPLFQPVKSVTRNRVLDVAFPDQVTIEKAVALVIMVRREESEGLKKILRVNVRLGVDEEDVVSSETFSLEFRTDEEGKPLPLDLTIKIESPDFAPPSQAKGIGLAPEVDSVPRIFLLEPKEAGDLVVNVELYNGDDFVAGCFLATKASYEVPQSVSTNLATVPIKTAVQSKPTAKNEISPTVVMPPPEKSEIFQPTMAGSRFEDFYNEEKSENLGDPFPVNEPQTSADQPVPTVSLQSDDVPYFEPPKPTLQDDDISSFELPTPNYQKSLNPSGSQPQDVSQTTFGQPMKDASGGQNKTLPIVSLVFAVLSISCYAAPLTGIVALVTGYKGMKNADHNPGEYGGRGLAIAGMVVGGVFFVIGLLLWAFIFLKIR